MKSVLLFVMIFSVFAIGQNLYRTDRIEEIEVVDVTSGDDSTVLSSSRAIKSDVAGIVKVKIRTRSGTYYNTVEYLTAGVWVAVGNISRVYRYYTGTTATTAQVYDSTGVLVNGIKVGR